MNTIFRGANILYRNNGNDNHWLHIKTIGVQSNRDGIGAKVKVFAGELSMLRQVGGGSFAGQNSLPAEFGLGKYTQVDEARQRFVGFTLDAPDDGFSIEGGKGYIVNVPEGRVVAFTGAAWTNQPPVEMASSLGRHTGLLLRNDGAWAFVVSGKLDVGQVGNLSYVTVRNMIHLSTCERTGYLVSPRLYS